MLIVMGLAAALLAAETPTTIEKTPSVYDVASATEEVVGLPQGPYIVEAEACLSWLDRTPMGPESTAPTEHPEFVRVQETSYQCIRQIRFGDPENPESGVTMRLHWQRNGTEEPTIHLLPSD